MKNRNNARIFQAKQIIGKKTSVFVYMEVFLYIAILV